jgi:ribosome-associated heat shock protein Hsp15
LPEPSHGEAGQRIDKWLWHARIVRTRTLAARLVASARPRINKTKTARASHTVRPGDVLTFVHGGQVRVLKILALAARRGPAAEASALYEDLSPEPQKLGPDRAGAPGPVAARPRGAGRPTKRDRRALTALRQR